MPNPIARIGDPVAGSSAHIITVDPVALTPTLMVYPVTGTLTANNPLGGLHQGLPYNCFIGGAPVALDQATGNHLPPGICVTGIPTSAGPGLSSLDPPFQNFKATSLGHAAPVFFQGHKPLAATAKTQHCYDTSPPPVPPVVMKDLSVGTVTNGWINWLL